MTQNRIAKIEDFCRTGSGSTPSRSEMGRYYEKGTVPWVKSGELREGIITSTDERVTEAALNETSIKLVPKGAILLAMYGATVGRLALLGVDATTNQAVCHIVPDPDMADTRYVYHALASQVPSIVAMGVGGAQPNISQGLVKKLNVYLPPLPKQRRIAAILDKANALRAKRREAIAYLDGLAQSVFSEMFGHPIENPKRYPTESLVDACHCYSGGTPSKSNESFWDGDLPWYSAKDLKHRDLFDSQDHINRSVTRTTNLKLLPNNTVAIVVRGMILAHTFPVCVLRTESTINQDLKALIPRLPIKAQYLASCLRAQASHVLQQVSEAGHGTKRLDTEALRKIIVPLPSLELQEEFVARIAAIEKLSRSHQLAQDRLDTLFHSLQHRAFTGIL